MCSFDNNFNALITEYIKDVYANTDEIIPQELVDDLELTMDEILMEFKTLLVEGVGLGHYDFIDWILGQTEFQLNNGSIPKYRNVSEVFNIIPRNKLMDYVKSKRGARVPPPDDRSLLRASVYLIITNMIVEDIKDILNITQ